MKLRFLLVLPALIFACAEAFAADPPWIFGMHDQGGESAAAEKVKQIWVVKTESIWHNPTDTGGPDYSDLTNAGHGVLCRLNNGYNPDGTIPQSQYYDDFAKRCGNFVAAARGACHIWIIGNEMNINAEWPNGVEITPALYAQCFKKCRDNIRSRPGHQNDWVIPGAIAPLGADAVQWFTSMLSEIAALGSAPDGFAIHCYSWGWDASYIFSDEKNADGTYKRFRQYRDYMNAIPAGMRNLPAFITETDPATTWWHQNIGWVCNAYQEINNWNHTPGNQLIRSLCLYRWMGDQWEIYDNPYIVGDWKNAMSNDYRWDNIITLGTVGGYVRDSGNSAISGATVTVNPGGYSTSSNSNGSYSISNIPAGAYTATASCGGYNPQTTGTLNVSVGQTTTANFSLIRQTGSISGVVLDSSNNTVGGAVVVMSPGGYSATSGSNGAYSIGSVPTGTYSLTATRNGYVPQTLSGRVVAYNQNTTCNFTMTPVTAIGPAKALPDGSTVMLSGVVIARFPITGSQTRVYIEGVDRTAGIAVATSASVAIGDEIAVTGTMSTVARERVVNASSVTIAHAGLGAPRPLVFTGRALGGGEQGLQPAAIDNSANNAYAYGLNNVGLLARVCGKVSRVDAAYNYFYVDDGSGISDGSGYAGFRVDSTGLPTPTAGQNVTVTGISGVADIGGRAARLLRPRLVSDLPYAGSISLGNPGFETGTLASWTSYGPVENPHSGTWFGGIKANAGSWFFGKATNGVGASCGVYQKVAVRSGLNCYGKAWSLVYRGGNDANSTQNRIGIDPTGGTNSTAATVVWSAVDTQSADYTAVWRELKTPLATCSGGYVTVFLDAQQSGSSGWHINCFDDAGISLGP